MAGSGQGACVGRVLREGETSNRGEVRFRRSAFAIRRERGGGGVGCFLGGASRSRLGAAGLRAAWETAPTSFELRARPVRSRSRSLSNTILGGKGFWESWWAGPAPEP